MGRPRKDHSEFVIRRIDELINDLQIIRNKFGNTVVAHEHIYWGARALWVESWKEQDLEKKRLKRRKQRKKKARCKEA